MLVLGGDCFQLNHSMPVFPVLIVNFKLRKKELFKYSSFLSTGAKFNRLIHLISTLNRYKYRKTHCLMYFEIVLPFNFDMIVFCIVQGV